MHDLVVTWTAVEADEYLGLFRVCRGQFLQLADIEKGGVGVERRPDAVERLPLFGMFGPVCIGRPDGADLRFQFLEIGKQVGGQVLYLAPGPLAGKGEQIPVLLPVPQGAGPHDHQGIGSAQAVAAYPYHAADEGILSRFPYPEAPGTEVGRGILFGGQELVPFFHPAEQPFNKGGFFAEAEIVLCCRMLAECRPLPVLLVF